MLRHRLCRPEPRGRGADHAVEWEQRLDEYPRRDAVPGDRARLAHLPSANVATDAVSAFYSVSCPKTVCSGVGRSPSPPGPAPSEAASAASVSARPPSTPAPGATTGAAGGLAARRGDPSPRHPERRRTRRRRRAPRRQAPRPADRRTSSAYRRGDATRRSRENVPLLVELGRRPTAIAGDMIVRLRCDKSAAGSSADRQGEEPRGDCFRTAWTCPAAAEAAHEAVTVLAVLGADDPRLAHGGTRRRCDPCAAGQAAGSGSSARAGDGDATPSGGSDRCRWSGVGPRAEGRRTPRSLPLRNRYATASARSFVC